MKTIFKPLATSIYLSALAASAHAQQPGPQDWPTFRHDNARTGAQPAASNLSDPKKVGTLKIRWSFPGSSAGPFIDTFAGQNQQHFAYLRSDGSIWDSFFVSGPNQWHLQQINCGKNSPCSTKNNSAVTDGPEAIAGPFIDTFAGQNQQHFAYLGNDGSIWDAFFVSGPNQWHLQQINSVRTARAAQRTTVL